MNTQMTERDQELWRAAKKRVGFKRHLCAYIIINTVLWLTWYFTGRDVEDEAHKFPWPAWSTLGWGIGLAFSFFDTYVFPKNNAIEREFEKLKNK